MEKLDGFLVGDLEDQAQVLFEKMSPEQRLVQLLDRGELRLLLRAEIF